MSRARADLVVWDIDIYSALTEKLKDIKAERTMLNGEVVYKAPESR